MKAKTQRCPACKQRLLQESYQPSNWGVTGQPCRVCQNQRTKQRDPIKKKQSSQKWRRTHPRYSRELHRLNRYGLTPTNLLQMLERQYYRCLGCQTAIGDSASVDHNHATSKIRGMLCDSCNHALGLVKENSATLYQLAAYLELDRTKQVIYLIGSLRNPNVVLLGNDIRALGYEVIDNWVAAGDQADNAWRDYSKARGRTYQEALKSREAQHIFNFDRAYLHLSDKVVMLYPAGASAHLEFGYAISLGKPGYLLMETPTERYDVMLQFAGSPLFHSKDELLEELKHGF